MTSAYKKFYSFLSYLLIVFSFSSFIHGMILLWDHFKPATFPELKTIAVESRVDANQLSPVQLHIAERNIHVPLIMGTVTDNNWLLSNDAGLVIEPSNATQSATIVYGHNYERILGNLPSVKVGDAMELMMSDWSKQQFEVIQVSEVSPNEVGVLFTEAKNDLVVYTCSGFLDSKRFVVRARLVSKVAST